MGIVFLVLYVLLKIGLLVWFKKIIVTGKRNIPKTGPVIFASNHPNMILDPILVAGSCNRLDGHFWAASILFKGLLGVVLRSAGGIPVIRRQDNKSGSPDSQADATEHLFSSSYEVLEKGEALYIFPEGTSYTSSHLLPLKTGTARLAIGFANRTNKNNFTKTDNVLVAPIVPVGLNYVAKDKFRSHVVVQFGEPIYPTIEELNDPTDGANHLTRRLDAALHAYTINTDSWEELVLIDLAHQIYTSNYTISLEKDIAVLHRFTEVYQKYHDDPGMIDLKVKLKQYKEELDRYGLMDYHFSISFAWFTIIRHLFRKVIKLILAYLLASPGFLLHLPLHLLAKFVVHHHPYVEEHCQRKFAIVIFCVPIWYSLLCFTVWWFLGNFYLGLSFIALPAFGYFHILEMELGHSASRSLQSLLNLMLLLILEPHHKLNKIRALRQEISTFINSRVRLLYPNEEDRIVTRETPLARTISSRENKVHLETF